MLEELRAKPHLRQRAIREREQQAKRDERELKRQQWRAAKANNAELPVPE